MKKLALALMVVGTMAFTVSATADCGWCPAKTCYKPACPKVCKPACVKTCYTPCYEPCYKPCYDPCYKPCRSWWDWGW